MDHAPSFGDLLNSHRAPGVVDRKLGMLQKRSPNQAVLGSGKDQVNFLLLSSKYNLAAKDVFDNNFAVRQLIALDEFEFEVYLIGVTLGKAQGPTKPCVDNRRDRRDCVSPPESNLYYGLQPFGDAPPIIVILTCERPCSRCGSSKKVSPGEPPRLDVTLPQVFSR